MMKVSVESNPSSSCPMSPAEMGIWAGRTVQRAGFRLAGKKLVLSVALVSSSAIRKLNRQYRQKDSATDILSFGEYPDSRSLKKEKKSEIFLGELVICCAVVKKSAKLNGVSLRKEFGYIFSHGILHLLGFDHGEKMFSIQDWIAQKIK